MRSLLLSLVVFSSASAFAAEPATWPQWRGPNRDGIVAGPAWPSKLKGQLTSVWNLENLGPSYSGPIVSEDRIFTTQTVDKKQEVVTAHDRKTGNKIWTAQWDGAISVPFFAAKNGSWIRSTPAYDGKTLYVAGIRDVIVALDAKTGAELWQRDLMKEFKAPAPDFGFVSSPLVDDTGVYVQAGGRFAKLSKTDGKVLWQSLKDGGGMMGSAFSSPVFAKLAGRDQIVVQTRTKLAGVDRKSGEELWSKEIPSFRGMNILTPILIGSDGIFTSTYGGTTRRLSLVTGSPNFELADKWNLKYEGNMTTPVLVDGHAYFIGKDRALICVNVETGKETWRTDQRFGEYWSMVANGDKILGLDQDGTLYLLKANPKEYELLDKMKVATNSWAHLAVCGEEVVIRDLTSLQLWKWAAK